MNIEILNNELEQKNKIPNIELDKLKNIFNKYGNLDSANRIKDIKNRLELLIKEYNINKKKQDRIDKYIIKLESKFKEATDILLKRKNNLIEMINKKK